MIMELIEWKDLSVGQIRSLTLLDDLVIREILICKLRKSVHNLSFEEVKQAWQKVLTKAKNEIDLEIIEIPDEDILDAIYGLLSKEFPYRQ